MFHKDVTHEASFSSIIDEDDKDKEQEFVGLKIELNDSEAYELLNFIINASFLTLLLCCMCSLSCLILRLCQVLMSC